MRKSVLWVTASFFAVAFLLTAAQAAPPSYTIRHETDPFVPEAQDYSQALSVLAENQDVEAVHMWVQVNEIGAAPWKESLEAGGIKLLNYIPNNAWIASVSTGLTAQDFQSLGVRWAGPLRPVDKMSRRVLENEEAPWAELDAGLRIFLVQFHKDVDPAIGRALLEGYGYVPGDYSPALNAQVAALDPARVEELAMEEEVKYIDVLAPPLEANNAEVRDAIEVDEVHVAPYNLDGTGSNVLVYDVGHVDQSHPDFSPNRVTYGESGGTATHGTHVGGTVGGNGTNNPPYKGMAPNTKITSYIYEACSPNCLYNSPWDMEENYGEGFTVHGANFSTNSLGSNVATNGYPCEWTGDYELTAQLLDTIIHGAGWDPGKPFLSVWANGNERQTARCGDQFYTTAPPATAKNTITVGSTQSNDHSISWFSSWGPVDDGRMRPDVAAPGCQTGGDGGTTSTRPGGGYTTLCGTSMAAPATSGVLALVLQEWRSSPFFKPTPLPSTLKALLANTATDYYNTGPDYRYGFGEIRATDAIDHLRNGWAFFDDKLDHGDELTYEFDVEAGTPKLKGTVCWSDYPGETLAEVELVNDIDIWFETPGGGTRRPWLLDPGNPSAPATTGIDVLNPIEQVEVNSPATGTWTLHVQGKSVPQGPQAFSVVVNQVRMESAASVDETPAITGRSATLFANRPNPFSPSTVLRFALDRDEERVSLKVFNAAGRLVRTLAEGSMPSGMHALEWDGRDTRGESVPAGVYYYQLDVSGEKLTRPMVMLK